MTNVVRLRPRQDKVALRVAEYFENRPGRILFACGTVYAFCGEKAFVRFWEWWFKRVHTRIEAEMLGAKRRSLWAKLRNRLRRE